MNRVSQAQDLVLLAMNRVSQAQGRVSLATNHGSQARDGASSAPKPPFASSPPRLVDDGLPESQHRLTEASPPLAIAALVSQCGDEHPHAGAHRAALARLNDELATIGVRAALNASASSAAALLVAIVVRGTCSAGCALSPEPFCPPRAGPRLFTRPPHRAPAIASAVSRRPVLPYRPTEVG
jgi:hypothetical protein